MEIAIFVMMAFSLLALPKGTRPRFAPLHMNAIRRHLRRTRFPTGFP